MAQQFKLPDGRIVEATADGKYRVVSGGPQPMTGGNPMLPGQIQGQGLNNQGQSLSNQKNAQTLPFDIRKASADASSAELKLRQDRVEQGLDPETGRPVAQANGDSDGPSGQAFLKTLSPADQRLVQAMSSGRLIPPTGKAAASPYWQKLLGQTLQYDPSFDAIDYGARYNTRKDFTSGQSSRNIKALNTAIGHVAQLADQIGGTASSGGYPFATTVNRIENAYARGSGDSGVTKFTQTAGAVSSELTQVFRGTGGAEADVQRYLSELDPNGSAEQKKAAVGNILGLLKSRLDAINDQYSKGMGTADGGLDVLDDHSKKALTKYLPGFIPPGGMGSSRDGYNEKPDPESAAFWENAARNGVPYRTALSQWQGDVKARGLQVTTPPPPAAYHKVAAYMRNPQSAGIEYHPFQATVRTPLSGLDAASNYVASSGPGAGAGHFLNAASATLPERAAGDEGAYFDAVSRADHPRWSTGGDIAGTVAGAYGANKALAPILQRAPGAVGSFFNAANIAEPELAPGVAMARQGLTSDMAFGGTTGAVQNPDHPIAGGLMGAAAMGGGNLAGRYTLGPALAAAGDTSFGQFAVNAGLKGANKVKGMFGGSSGGPAPFSPPAPLDPGQSLLVGQTGRGGLGGISGKMDDAINLKMPYALADADPRLRSLAGSASRKSPDVRALAENTIGPRNMGQAERAISSIDRHLAPIGDVPTMKADAVARAQGAAAPLYEKAYADPARTNDALEGLLATPAGRQALGRARMIAANERRDPATMGFDLNAQGETVLTHTPSVQTLDYVKRGLDDILEQYRDPVTQRMNLDEAGRAIQSVRHGFVAEVDKLHPKYREARQAYQGIVRQGTAAESGSAATSIKTTPEQAQIMATNSGENLPHFQRGYASSLADTVERTRLARDPYETIFGSPAQQLKMGIVFPQGAERFGQARRLESDMSKTHHELLGGSDTAARAQADSMFDNPMIDNAMEFGQMALTGVPSPKLLARGMMKFGDLKRFGGKGGMAKADQVGPLLLNPDPAANKALLEELTQLSLARKNYVNQSRSLGGMFGAPTAYGLYLNR